MSNDPASSVGVLDPLTDMELEFVNFLEQHFLKTGGIPTEQYIVDKNLYASAFYKRCFKKANFRNALAMRGISLRGLDGPDAGKLTEEQLVVANTMLDRLGDTRSSKKKLAELGITSTKWEAWLRDPVFQSYLRTRSEALLGDNLHEGHLALLDRVRSGDTNAIKFYYELTGRYNPNAKDNVNVASVLSMIVEVLQRHITDPSLLKAIAEDISLIAGGINASTGNSLMGGNSIDPGKPKPLQVGHDAQALKALPNNGQRPLMNIDTGVIDL